jgi:hypothetical protein
MGKLGAGKRENMFLIQAMGAPNTHGVSMMTLISSMVKNHLGDCFVDNNFYRLIRGVHLKAKDNHECRFLKIRAEISR